MAGSGWPRWFRALRDAIEAARAAIKEYFRERAAQRARHVVEEWKTADIYPFEGEPATPVEKAERQVFDIVAVNVQEFAPDLATAAPRTRALHLRMLRNAIERGPDDLQMILKEVLDLPERKQKELAALLQETTLRPSSRRPRPSPTGSNSSRPLRALSSTQKQRTVSRSGRSSTRSLPRTHGSLVRSTISGQATRI